jgi:K+-transporting ATPase KdpF subunit
VGSELTGYIVSAVIALLAAIYLIIALVAPERF